MVLSSLWPYRNLAPWEWIPVLNLVHELLHGATPTFGYAHEVLNNLCVVSALLIAVCLAIPGAVSFDELEAANARFADVQSEAGYGRFWAKSFNYLGNTQYSDKVAVLFTISTSFMASVLISCLFTLFYTGRMKDLTDRDSATTNDDFRVFWRYGRFLMIAQLILCCVGIVFTFLAAGALFEVKFPDRYIDETGDVVYDKRSPLGFNYAVQLCCGLVIIGSTALTLSHITAKRHQHHREKQQEESEEKEATNAVATGGKAPKIKRMIVA